MRCHKAVAALSTVLLIAAAGELSAADPAGEATPDSGSLSLFPIVFYTPETSLALGAMATYAFRPRGSDPTARRSGIPVFAAYTFKNQFIAATRPNIYLDGERWNLEGALEVSVFPDTLYPSGPDSQKANSETFASRRLVFEPAATLLLWQRLRAGVRGTVRYIEITESKPGGLLATGALAGADGGFRVGLGPVLVWDSRDNNFTTYQGARHEVSATFFSRSLGSASNFSVYQIDARQFFTLVPGHVLGLQLFGHFAAGDVPFDYRGRIGGAYRMRGFFEGRFADRHMVTAQAQYTFPVVSWLRLAAFGGTGQVAPALDKFSTDNFVYSGGGGVRIALNKQDRVNLRIDIAVTSTGEVNGYLHMIEAF